MCLLPLRRPLLFLLVVSPNEIGTKNIDVNGVAATTGGVKASWVSGGTMVESECALKPTPFLSMSSVLGEC